MTLNVPILAICSRAMCRTSGFHASYELNRPLPPANGIKGTFTSPFVSQGRAKQGLNEGKTFRIKCVRKSGLSAREEQRLNEEVGREMGTVQYSTVHRWVVGGWESDGLTCFHIPWNVCHPIQSRGTRQSRGTWVRLWARSEAVTVERSALG